MTQPVTQRVTGPPATTYPVAELERRFYAFAIDRLLTWLLFGIAGVLAWLVLGDAWWTVAAIVAGLMVLTWLALAAITGTSGSSPGKSAVGLRVVHQGSGTPIGVGPALLRSLVLALSSLPTFGIGMATLAWTAVEDRGRQRRGWHDHLAHSVVIDVRPVPVVEEAVDEAPRHVVNLTAMRLIPASPVEVVMPAPTRVPEPPMRRQPVTTEQQRPPAAAPPRPTTWPDPLSAPPADPGRTVARPSRRSVPTTRWRVTFDTGESFLVEGLALVGRRPEPRAGEVVRHVVPLLSADMSVSKTHAQFGPAPDGLIVVMDRGSTNGSVLIRKGVPRPLTAGKPATLLDGDKVTFGDREMTITREA